MSDLTHTFTVSATPQEVYEAIIDVRSWWGATNIVGPTDQLGADWFYLVPDIHYSKQRTAELVAGERVVWEFTDGTSTSSQRRASGSARRAASTSPPAAARRT